MTEPINRVVIVGASLAGAGAAAALRERGFDGELVLLGSEQLLPYERPSLSKAFLSGTEADPTWVHDADFYDAQHIDLRLGTTATRIDRSDRLVVTDSGEELRYDRLILATGSSPKRLPIPGADLDGVLTLRTVQDSVTLRERATEAGRIVVVGAGWIGAEAAASLRQLGVEVVLIDPLPTPLASALGPDIGTHFARLHAGHGVALRMQQGVEEFVGAHSVSGVRLKGAELVPAPVVLVGVGAAPRLQLANDAGLTMAGGGVRVDSTLATSDPAIYAVGDIAAVEHPRYGAIVRVEHWANAKDQGAFVAGNVLGERAPFEAPPFFFTDQYDLGMEYRGWVDPNKQAQIAVRGNMDEGNFFAFWLQEGQLTAAMNVNEWDEADALDDLVRRRSVVDPARLADPHVPLSDLAT